MQREDFKKMMDERTQEIEKENKNLKALEESDDPPQSKIDKIKAKIRVLQIEKESLKSEYTLADLRNSGTSQKEIEKQQTQVRTFASDFTMARGAKFHSKSHVCMSSDNHRKSFTPELLQSFTAKVMFVFRQTITAKVSHQNCSKVSKQKSWSYIVRQSPQKFHTRTGAKFHSKSHGCMSWS